EANILGLAETGELIQAMVEQFKALGDQIPGLPFQLGPVKPVKGEPTYLGMALTLKPETATVDVFVPGAAMNVGVKMLAPLFRTIEYPGGVCRARPRPCAAAGRRAVRPRRVRPGEAGGEPDGDHRRQRLQNDRAAEAVAAAEDHCRGRRHRAGEH